MTIVYKSGSMRLRIWCSPDDKNRRNPKTNLVRWNEVVIKYVLNVNIEEKVLINKVKITKNKEEAIKPINT